MRPNTKAWNPKFVKQSKKKNPEQGIQKEVVAWLRKYFPDKKYCWTATLDEAGVSGKRSTEANKRIIFHRYGMGINGGQPDLSLDFCKLKLELKAPGKKATAAQLKRHKQYKALGWQVAVVDSYREAQSVICLAVGKPLEDIHLEHMRRKYTPENVDDGKPVNEFGF